MIQPQLPFNDDGATFSACGKYRFRLWRIWDKTAPLIMFVGLNPSTANAEKNDPTIRRVEGFAKQWGYGGFFMMNLFPFVTAYPEMLEKNEASIKVNDLHLQSVARICDKIICAWGNFKTIGNRADDVIHDLRFYKLYCLGKNSNGSPKHPLYLAKTTELIKFI
jgi:hypothetical protein